MEDRLNTDVNSWEEFKEELNRLTLQRTERQESTPWSISPFLFRGESCHSRGLKTTLERFTKDDLSLEEYYRVIVSVKPEIEAFAGVKYEIPNYHDYQLWLSKHRPLSVKHFSPGCNDFLGKAYMIYLRHHMFPSPLLDWTCSPYIAAYFAFKKEPKQDTEKVSISVFCESPAGGKNWPIGKSGIHRIRGGDRCHRRHFFQQSEYTICTILKGDKWYYSCHADVLERRVRQQDVLRKFNIPVTERLKVLKELDDYNLTSFSLFGSEESLMETLALRQFHLRDKSL